MTSNVGAVGDGSGARSVPPRLRVPRVLSVLWAAPASLVGLALGLPLWALGGRVAVHDGVVEFTAARRARGRALPFDAITFGHVVLARSAAAHEALRVHERMHVRQYEAWGALFLLAYPLESLWQLARGRDAYRDNRFEVQARRAGVAGARAGRPVDARPRSR